MAAAAPERRFEKAIPTKSSRLGVAEQDFRREWT
jgi:hypothetical protein